MKYILLFSLFIYCSCGNSFFIVRHAEKAPVEAGASQLQASDPPLSEAGQVRAMVLRQELKNDNVQYIFSTNYQRTLSTAQPLNELRGATAIELYSSKKDSLDAFIEKLKSIKKGNVLVVGHSNTIDDIANKLAGKTVVPGDLQDTEYDNLYVLKRKRGSYIFTNRKYGAPSK